MFDDARRGVGKIDLVSPSDRVSMHIQTRSDDTYFYAGLAFRRHVDRFFLSRHGRRIDSFEPVDRVC
jgi:hypothetical protein